MSDHDAQPVAGWYDNPEGEGQRYWDGRQWTDQDRDSRWNPVAQVERLSSQLFTTLFVAKELSTLPGYLQEGEDLRHMVWGFYNGGHVGLVAATDRRVLFLSAGILGRTEFEDLPFTKISSVQQSSGLLTASITVYATGAKAGFSGMNTSECDR